MSITSTKNLGLRGSKGRIIEKNIEDEIYIGGPFTATEGLDFESIDGFLTVDERGNYDKVLTSQPYGFRSNVQAVVTKCVQQPDGKILLGGIFVGLSGFSKTSRLFRLNADYTVDTTFWAWANTVNSIINSEVYDISLQSDGKILVVGDFTTSFAQVPRNRIVRLNSDSTIDNTFNVGTGFGTSTSNPVRVIKELSDGKILVGTNYTTYNGITVTRLLRLNSDGSVDDTFNIGTGPGSTVTCIEFQSDGKMLVGGYFTTFNGVTVNRIVRLNTDLSIDDTFRINTGTAFNSDVETITIQSDGKILVGGNFTTFNNVSANRLVRLNEDGSRDTTFNIGTGFNGRVRKINIQITGKILVGGTYSTYRGTIFNNIIGLTYTGEIDDSFDVGNGIVLVSSSNSSNGVYDILKLNDGRILICGGEFSCYKGNVYDRRILKLNSKLEIDRNFQNAFTSFYSTTQGSINSIKIQSDGKILIGADGTSFRLVRIFPNGKRDGNFSAATFNDGIEKIDIQSDGKIVVSGPFTTVNSISSNRIARLESNGARDASFNIGSGSNSLVKDIVVVDDKIIVGGGFTSYSGSVSNRIVRINPSGSIDTDFNIGSGFNDTVNVIRVQSDNKILVGGNFTSYNGTSINRLVRLNTDGSIDNSFNIGTGFASSVFTIYVQPDNKILVGGGFYQFNGQSRIYIVRLLSDGSIDNSFQSPVDVGSGVGVYTIDMTSDNKILIGGFLRGLNGQVRSGFAVLRSDGTLSDETFNISVLFDSLNSTFSETGINTVVVKK